MTAIQTKFNYHRFYVYKVKLKSHLISNSVNESALFFYLNVEDIFSETIALYSGYLFILGIPYVTIYKMYSNNIC